MCVCVWGGGGGGGVASYLAINELLSVLKNQLHISLVKGVWRDTMSGQKPLLQIEEIAQNFNWQFLQFKFPITAKHHSFRQTSTFTQGAYQLAVGGYRVCKSHAGDTNCEMLSPPFLKTIGYRSHQRRENSLEI